jgi:hypothetical protein
MSEFLAEAQVLVRPNTAQFRTDLQAQLDSATRGVSVTIPTVAAGVGSDLAAGLSEATAQTEALSEETATLGASLSDTATGASALLAASERASVAERNLAASTVAETRAVRQAAVEEQNLFRIRSRRAQPLGPVRLAGVGVAAGAAIFAATQAIGELSAALRVTGNEAITTTGRMRNFGASILSGNIVGAFKALRIETQQFSLEQLRVIALSPGVERAFESMGKGADIARSRIEALKGLGTVPQFIQTAIARTEVAGDTQGQIRSLQAALDDLKKQEEIARQLKTSLAVRSGTLKAIFIAQKAAQDQLKGLRVASQTDVLGPLEEAVVDARLAGSATNIITALQNERVQLQRVIAAEGTSADDRRKFKDQLLSLNQEIESTQAEIAAEAKRHRDAMLRLALLPGEEAVVAAQLGGSQSDLISALRSQAEGIQAQIDAKGVESEQRLQLRNQLVSINSQIESIQDSITAEAERHQQDIQRLQDEADAAVAEQQERRRRPIERRIQGAEGTETLKDDIRFGVELRKVLNQQIEQAQKTIQDAEERGDVIADLRDRLVGVITDLREDRKRFREEIQRELEERQERIRTGLQLDVDFFKITGNRGAEIQARQRLIAQLRKEIKAIRGNRILLKEKRNELAQEIKDLNDLKGTTKDRGKAFKTAAFEFLQTQQGFAANLLGNLLPSGATAGTVGGGAAQASVLPRPSPAAALSEESQISEARGAVPSRGQAASEIEVLRQILRVLKDVHRGTGHPEARFAQIAHGASRMDIG